MAQLGPGPQKASDVAGVVWRTSQNPGPTRAELINMDLHCTPEHGYAAFTVPHFDRFLLHAIPVLKVPELKRRKTPRVVVTVLSRGRPQSAATASISALSRSCSLFTACVMIDDTAFTWSSSVRSVPSNSASSASSSFFSL